MSNYDHMLADALRRFTTYDPAALAAHPGVEQRANQLHTVFLGEPVVLDHQKGTATVGGRSADFGETLSILDWLCDGDPCAKAAEEYCTVSSLPGVYVGGSGLTMRADALAQKIHENPEAFRCACRCMGGKELPLGDLGCSLSIFPGLSVCLKFYFGDEEFPPQLTLLWDKNILQFVRYETVYYIAGCLRNRLQRLL